MLSPLHVWLGPAWFRRFLVNLIPDPNVQHLKNVADIMDSQSRGIYRSKKEALLGGDEELKQQIGQGKDIMSVLRTSLAIQGTCVYSRCKICSEDESRSTGK